MIESVGIMNLECGRRLRGNDIKECGVMRFVNMRFELFTLKIVANIRCFVKIKRFLTIPRY